MKKYIYPLLTLLFTLSCTNEATAPKSSQTIDSLISEITARDEMISKLNDSISILKYPADQRLATIKKHVTDGEYEKALSEISLLETIFPMRRKPPPP